MKLLASICAALFIASQVFAGITFTTVVKTEGARKSSDNQSTMKSKVEGDNAKIEWIQGKGPGDAGKGYMLIKDGGKILYMVNPEKKEYVDMSGMTQLAGGLVNMKVKEYKIEKTLDEAGPDILGYPTRHYKFITTFTMEMTIFGMKKENTGKTEQEVWASTKVKIPAMAAFEKFGSQMAAGFGDLQKIIDAEKEKSMKGFPLRTVTVSDTGTPDKPQLVKTIAEITEIKEGSIADSEFSIPSDYKEIKIGMPPPSTETPESGTKTEDESSEPAPKKRSMGLESLFKALVPKQ